MKLPSAIQCVVATHCVPAVRDCLLHSFALVVQSLLYRKLGVGRLGVNSWCDFQTRVVVCQCAAGAGQPTPLAKLPLPA